MMPAPNTRMSSVAMPTAGAASVESTTPPVSRTNTVGRANEPVRT